MKPVVLSFAVCLLLTYSVVWRHERADSKLTLFYKQVQTADFAEAQKTINEAIYLWPTNSRYYGWRAYCNSQKLPSQCSKGTGAGAAPFDARDREAAKNAITDYRRALVLNNRDAVAYHNLAWLEHLLGDDDSAIRDWQEACLLDPNDATFRLSFGMFLEEKGDLAAAKLQYGIAIQLAPTVLDSPFFVRFRERAPEVAKDLVSESISKFEQELARTKDPIIEARLGKLYLSSGNFERAKQLLEDATGQLPNLPLVWFNLGDIYEMNGQPAEALRCFRKATLIDGSLAGPYLQIATLDLEQGDRTGALHNSLIALQDWQLASSVSAAHNNRLYKGPRQQIDDLLPTTLVWYVKPCEATQALSELSTLSPGRYGVHTDRPCEDLPSPHLFKVNDGWK